MVKINVNYEIDRLAIGSLKGIWAETDSYEVRANQKLLFRTPMLTEIYGGPFDIDDFCKAKMQLIAKTLRHCEACEKVNPSQLTPSEVMTILVYYHLSPYKNLKAYIIPAISAKISNETFLM